jgi:hypothetical protein
MCSLRLPVRDLRTQGHLPCNTRVTIDPPCPSNASLSVEYAELVESKLLLQLACHGDPGRPSTDNDDGIVCVCIVLVAVHSSNRFANHLDAEIQMVEKTRRNSWAFVK